MLNALLPQKFKKKTNKYFRIILHLNKIAQNSRKIDILNVSVALSRFQTHIHLVNLEIKASAN